MEDSDWYSAEEEHIEDEEMDFENDSMEEVQYNS